MNRSLPYRLLLGCALCMALRGNVFAQTQDALPTRILFVFDASRSMTESWDRVTKMYAAIHIVDGIVDSLDHVPGVYTALRVFGHQSPQPLNDCHDTKLEVGFKTNNGATIRAKLRAVQPQGITPISYSLEKSADDFGADTRSYRNIIILITDGFESCGLNPCETVLRLKNAGIVTKSYIIGIGIEEEDYKEFECMGDFMNVPSYNKSTDIVNETIARIFNATQVRVNLLDIHKQPSETDVDMTFYDKSSGDMKYNYYHTLNPKGSPDTILLDPNLSYSLEIHTTPPVWKKDIDIDPSGLNTINVSTPQGFLKVAVNGETFKARINCIVLQDGKEVHVQSTNETQKFLVGTYDLEILSIPVITIRNVQVEQNKTTTVEIPAPGYLTVIKNDYLYGAIYSYDEDKLVELFEFSPANLKETLAIQPGKYKIIYRYKSKRAMTDTREKSIEVSSGGTLTVTL